MAKNDSAPVKKPESYPLGHAKEAKDASAWAYKFPQSTGTDRDIGVYAQPGPNTAELSRPDLKMGNGQKPRQSAANEVNMTIGNITRNGYDQKIKTEGVTMRGYGAATKGIKSRGPMA